MARTSPRLSNARRKAQKAGFRSAFENRVADILTKHKISFEYEPRDKKLEYTLPSKGVCANCGCHDIIETHEYLPDFLLEGGMVLETKGRLDAKERKKFISLCSRHDNIIMLFQNDKNKITRKSKYTYGDWATKNGIKWMSFHNDWILEVKELVKSARKKNKQL